MAPNQQTLMELGALAMKVAGHPKTRRKFLSQVKEIDPNYRIPADVQIEEFKENFAREQQEKELKAQTERKQRNRAQQRQKLLDSGSYTEEQVAEIEEKVMKKYGLDDFDAGAKLYAADFKPQTPTNSQQQRHGRTWEFPNLPGLLENPDKAANDAAYAVIDELRQGR